jgi:hypothetical protein
MFNYFSLGNHAKSTLEISPSLQNELQATNQLNHDMAYRLNAKSPEYHIKVQELTHTAQNTDIQYNTTNRNSECYATEDWHIFKSV